MLCGPARSTTTAPLAAEGMVITIWVSLHDVTDARTPPTRTVLAPCTGPNPMPSMVSVSPTRPKGAEIFCTSGPIGSVVVGLPRTMPRGLEPAMKSPRQSYVPMGMSCSTTTSRSLPFIET